METRIARLAGVFVLNILMTGSLSLFLAGRGQRLADRRQPRRERVLRRGIACCSSLFKPVSKGLSFVAACGIAA